MSTERKPRKDVTLLEGKLRITNVQWEMLLEGGTEIGKMYFLRNPFNLNRWMAIKIRENRKFVMANFSHNIVVELRSIPPLLMEFLKNFCIQEASEASIEYQKIQMLMSLPMNSENALLQRYCKARFYIDWLLGRFPPNDTDEVIYLE